MTKLGPYEIHPLAEKFPLIEGKEFDELIIDIELNGLNEPIVLSPDGTTIVDGRNRYLACEKAEIVPEYRVLGKQYGPTQIVDFIVAANLHRRHLSMEDRGFLGAEILIAREAAVREAESRRKSKFPTGTKSDMTVARVPQSCPNPAEMSRPLTEMERYHELCAALPPDVERPEYFKWRRDAPLDEKPLAQKSREVAAKEVSASPRYVQQARTVIEQAPDLIPKVKAREMSMRAAEREVRKRAPAPPVKRPEPTADQLAAQRKKRNEKILIALATAVLTVKGAVGQAVSDNITIEPDHHEAAIEALVTLRETLQSFESLLSGQGITEGKEAS